MDHSYIMVLQFQSESYKSQMGERIIYVIVIKDIINQLKRMPPLRYTILYNREVMQHLSDEIFSISKRGCFDPQIGLIKP